MKSEATGYMCLIDWEHEIGHATYGNRIFPSVRDLEREHPSVQSCGIVRVKITLDEVIRKGAH